MGKKVKNTYVIAEIGNSHEGSVGLAKCFIKAAAQTGVDAIKFQTHIFDAESLPDAPNPKYFKDESRKEYFERTAFSLSQYKELKRYAEKECNVDFLSSVFSIESVEMLEEVGVDAYKIPSGEVNNIPLLRRVAQTGKKVYISSGMSSWQEIDEAVEVLQGYKLKDIVLFQCTTEYPCSPENAGLNIITEMLNKYDVEIGYSDHTMGVASAIASIMLGATVIEKHFILSNSMYGSDALHSTEPKEFEYMINEIRKLDTMLVHDVDKDKIASTLTNMKEVFEKSIVASIDIAKGTVLSEKHLAFKKPGDGIKARHYEELFGKIVNKDVKKNHKFLYDDFEK